MNSKALAASVIDANPVAQWYETRNPFSFMLPGTKILTQISSIPVAASLADARTNATANPTLISNLSAVGDAIRLTAVAGTNDSTWLAYSTYNDTTSAKLDNWIQPQIIPQTTGAASIGYTVVLYEGDPNAGGTEITTTEGTSGTGATKSVGWIFNYALGMLLLADDFKSTVTNPYVLGFRYTGTTANDASSNAIVMTADETIAIGDVLRVVQTGEGGLTAGRVVKAIASSALGSEVVGVATSAATQGNTITMETVDRLNLTFGSTPASASNGGKVYLSTTGGKASLTPPSSAGDTVVQLGILVGGNGSDSTVGVLLNIKTLITIG
jgi:plasmid maintenance system antidote protein VapI